MSARIVPTTPDDAPQATKPILQQLKQAFGMVPKLFATIGHSPGALQSLLAWDAAVAQGSLSQREIELLNLHVSELNGCGYCISAHSALAKRAGISAEETLAGRYGSAANPREQALLALARRVVRTGGGGTGTEVAAAREAGLSEAEIIDALAIVALKTFTNAVALVAGTEVDFPKATRLPSP